MNITYYQKVKYFLGEVKCRKTGIKRKAPSKAELLLTSDSGE